ncbi:MAG: hypothetical protein US33_C0006G0016 [Parcubacteria group bacterium GW2011_GWC1_36_9]|nr:MAG: hypothetical protein US33_C0006G0016 [Parcubacteria group bacterium GW2011_GWC1_36_9]
MPINNVPKIIIKYNRFLDPIFVFYCKNNPELQKRGWNDWMPPQKKEIANRIKNYRIEWAKQEDKILQGICKILDLDFKRNIIDVHIVSGNPRDFSEPLIMKGGYTPEDFVDTLSHELIHILLQDNVEKIPITILSKMFPKESNLTKNHIITYATLKYIYLEIFKDESKLNKNIKKSLKSSLPDYSRAWKIVEEKGYGQLIIEFKNKYLPINRNQ